MLKPAENLQKKKNDFKTFNYIVSSAQLRFCQGRESFLGRSNDEQSDSDHGFFGVTGTKIEYLPDYQEVEQK